MKKITTFAFFALVLLTLAACDLLNGSTSTPLSSMAEPTVAQVPLLTTMPTPTVTDEKTITVYFTDEARFNVGTEPYEVAVSRPLPEGVDPVRAVLDALFAGPTPEEAALGLRLFSSGFTGVREYTLENGIARIHLDGKCANNGAAYSVASVINKNLSQFPQITAFKIYDENDSNLDPDSAMSSVPYCLEP